MTNYSGIVNKQDASDHGAAVIYGNGKNESAVDNYLDTIALEAKAKKAQAKVDEQDATRANVNVLSQIDKAWSPHSQYIHKQYEDWQKVQKLALQTKNPKEKYDLQAKADLQRANIITTVSHSEEQKKMAEAEKLDQIKNFDLWDEQDIFSYNNYVGRTDVDPFNEPYIPSGRRMQDRLLNDIKKVKVSPTMTVEKTKEKVQGKDYDAYYEVGTITDESIDNSYNTLMSTPSNIKAKARFIASRTQQSIPYADAEKEWEQNIKSQILANSGGGEQVVDANGKVSYVNRKKKGNVSEWGPSSTFNFGGDGNGAVNKSGTIVMSVQPKADGSEEISLSNTGIDGKTADFVAPTTKDLIKTIVPGIAFDQRVKDQVEIVSPTYIISPDRKSISMSGTVVSTIPQTILGKPEEKKLHTISNVPILQDGKFVKGGKEVWDALNVQQKFNITIDENGVVSKTPNATTRQTVGNKATVPNAAPKTQSAPATNVTTNEDDEIIGSTLDFENKKGYSNYGFTSYNGNLDRTQALEKAKKEYLPMVKDLPAPLRAVAFDFAFNSEDPRASLMVAAGIISLDNKKAMYKGGKLDEQSVNDAWQTAGGKQKVLEAYSQNPKAFLDSFDKERKRSYDNTNGADEKGNEWYERVDASRKVADKLLNKTNASAPKAAAPTPAPAPNPAPQSSGWKTYKPGMFKKKTK